VDDRGGTGGMIELAWWVLVPLVLLALLGAVVVVGLAAVGREDRKGLGAQRRAVYLDWCIRNRWCPEHDDEDGHIGILPDGPSGLLTVRPCPGSPTRRVVLEPRSAAGREAIRREAERIERQARAYGWDPV
jgi:hypothetical protein